MGLSIEITWSYLLILIINVQVQPLQIFHIDVRFEKYVNFYFYLEDLKNFWNNFFLEVQNSQSIIFLNVFIHL